MLEASGARAREERQERGDPGQRDERGRKRRERRSSEYPDVGASPDPSSHVGRHVDHHVDVVPARDVSFVPDAAASATAAISEPDAVTADAAISIPLSVHEAVTQPAHLPPELPLGAEPPEATPTTRAKSLSVPPPMDELDGGWDMGDEDPTATKAEDSPPSSGEMAGDGSVEGDGLDQVD